MVKAEFCVNFENFLDIFRHTDSIIIKRDRETYDELGGGKQRLYVGLEISGEIVRFKNRAERSHFNRNTEVTWLALCWCGSMYYCLFHECVSVRMRYSEINYETVRNARHSVNLFLIRRVFFLWQQRESESDLKLMIQILSTKAPLKIVETAKRTGVQRYRVLSRFLLERKLLLS